MIMLCDAYCGINHIVALVDGEEGANERKLHQHQQQLCQAPPFVD